MTHVRVTLLATGVLCASLAAAQTPPPQTPALRLRMLAAEDARETPASGGLAPALAEGLASEDAELRRVAVRALGRLERPALVSAIARVLGNREASVRAEAADALAQSVFTATAPDEITAVATLLRGRLRAESHPLVKGALAAALGRLRYPTDDAGRAAGLTVLEVAFPRASDGTRSPASAAVLLGALRGLHAVALAGTVFGAPRRDASGLPVTWMPDEGRDAIVAMLAKQPARASAPSAPGATGQLPSPAPSGSSVAEGATRRLAIQALAATRRTLPELGLALLEDGDPVVRAFALRWAIEVLKDETALADVTKRWAAMRGVSNQRAVPEVAPRVARLESLLNADPAPLVRFEAVRSLAQTGVGAQRGCRRMLAAIDDADLNVAKYAMANARDICGTNTAVSKRLEALSAVEPAGDGPGGWHRYAFALHGFALVDPSTARPRVLTALASANPWVRRYGALAAEAILADAGSRQTRDEEVERGLARLVGEGDANLATTALHALAAQRRADARAPALQALGRDDGELLLEATAALLPAGPAEGEGGTRNVDAEAAAGCAGALERLTAARRETSRDPRLALVDCVGRLGTSAHARRLEPLLSDFDDVVARKAATAIAALRPGSAPPSAAPKARPRAPLPTDGDLVRLAAVRVTLHVGGRGPVVLRLRPDEAPLNAARFLRLAEAGYFTGLTFHRIVPAFIVQGGSPGGNEFSGDGPFSRDEVGRLANLRDTVGLSTRGRDTGDAQFYVNLVDNLRLDHTYTVFGRVESGMEVVDALLEGDVIERVEVSEGR